jgi:DMSO/TMAO reductase YedYZ molybdopterin-dependent catalytic subunit
MAIGLDELGLAARNHGFPLEMLREPITPVGLHYLLVHFDIPALDDWRLAVGDATFTLDELRARERRTLPVTFECAGNGRALLANHEPSQPWLNEAVGTAEWTGTPLARLLHDAGIADAPEFVFTGADRGVQGGVEHAYERSLTREQALHDDVLLAYEMNGEPLPAQHGAPLRLVVPGWYGMTNVKWLVRIAPAHEPFAGWQQQEAYRIEDVPVERMLPRSLFVPPGIPDFLSRRRFLAPGVVELTGRAWSGQGSVERVQISTDAGSTWADAELGEALGDYAWRGFRFEWAAAEGEHELCCRATDSAGNVQPLEGTWNHGGYCNNAVQRVPVEVRL